MIRFGVLASMLLASLAHGATLTLDLDQASYVVGDDIVVTATLVTDGTEEVGNFGLYELAVSWDPAVASVKNGSLPLDFGSSSQQITMGPNQGGFELSYTDGGSASSFPDLSCNNDGSSCVVLGQFFDVFTAVTLDAQTLVGQLVLEAQSVGALDHAISSFVFQDGSPPELDDPPNTVLGANWSGPVAIVPEPSTATLLALGLAALAAASRRR